MAMLYSHNQRVKPSNDEEGRSRFTLGNSEDQKDRNIEPQEITLW